MHSRRTPRANAVAELRSLDVRLYDESVGTLVIKRSGALRYEPRDQSTLLSVGDRSGDDWSESFTRTWFEGLLPEGESRNRIAARFGVAPADTFALLEAIGWECAGAVMVVPDSYAPGHDCYRDLSDAEVGERLDALPGHPYDDENSLRVSLGGQQDKLVLARNAEGWRLSLGGSPTTHIIKPEPSAWPGPVEAEAWSLKLVGHVTPAATAVVTGTLGSRPALIVSRFDRVSHKGGVERLHQEDVCQVLGLLPSRKYSEAPGRAGDASYQAIAELLRANAVDVAAELRSLLRQMVAHVVLMDTDAHGKNVSLLHHRSGYVRLSPVYDILPTTAFLGSQKHLAMSVNGRYRIDQIERSDLAGEAHAWGYPRSRAETDVDAAIAGFAEGIAAADEAFPDINARARLQVTDQLFRLQHSA